MCFEYLQYIFQMLKYFTGYKITLDTKYFCLYPIVWLFTLCGQQKKKNYSLPFSCYEVSNKPKFAFFKKSFLVLSYLSQSKNAI